MNATATKRWLLNALVCALAIGAGYLLIEGGLRLYLFHSLMWPHAGLPPLRMPPDPVMGWKPAPNQCAVDNRMEHQGLVRTNSKGLCDGEHAYDPAPGVFRIVILGDSFMQGASVDPEEAVPALLEQQFAGRRVEVINLGVKGYSTVQELLYLKEEGVKYRPDLVLAVVYAENDVCDNVRPLAERLYGKDALSFYARPYGTWDDEKRVLEIVPGDIGRARNHSAASTLQDRPFVRKLASLKKSLAGQVYRQTLRSVRQKVFFTGDDPNVFLGAHMPEFHPVQGRGTAWTQEDYSRHWEEAWTVTEQSLRAINGIAESIRARFGIVTAPSKLQAEAEYLGVVRKRFPGVDLDPNFAEERLRVIAENAKIPFLGLVDAFRLAHEKDKTVLFYGLDDTHWNAEGHRLATRCIAKWLNAAGLIAHPDSP